MSSMNDQITRLSQYTAMTADDEEEELSFCQKVYLKLTSCCPGRSKLKPPKEGTWAHSIYSDLLEVKRDYKYQWSVASLEFFATRAPPDHLRPSDTRERLVRSIKNRVAEESSKHIQDIRISQEYGIGSGTAGRGTQEYDIEEINKTRKMFNLSFKNLSDMQDENEDSIRPDLDPFNRSKGLGSRTNSWAVHFLPTRTNFKDYTQLVDKPSANKLNSGWFHSERPSEKSEDKSQIDAKIVKTDQQHDNIEPRQVRLVSNMTAGDMPSNLNIHSRSSRMSDTSMIMLNSQFVADADKMEMFDIYVFLNRAIMKASLEQYANQSTMKSVMKLDHKKVVEELSRPSSFFSQWLDCCINMTIREFDKGCKSDDTNKELMHNLTNMFNSIKIFTSTISKAMYSLLNEGPNGLDMGLAPADTYIIPIFDVIFNKKTFNKKITEKISHNS